MILETFKCADCGEEFTSKDGFHALCSKCRKRMERLRHQLMTEGEFYEPEDSLDRWFE